MTKEEKTHKLKLIMLIIICKREVIRRNESKSFYDAWLELMDLRFWLTQLVIVQSQPIPKQETVCLAYINNNREEVIISKNGKMYKN